VSDDFLKILDEIAECKIKNVESSIIGVLSVRHPEILRGALEDVKRMTAKKESGS
jgi:hypothetical protein